MQLRDGVIRGCTKGLKVQSARRVKHVAREWRDNLELRACLGGRFRARAKIRARVRARVRARLRLRVRVRVRVRVRAGARVRSRDLHTRGGVGQAKGVGVKRVSAE